MDTEPVLSYDGFLQYIREEFTEDGAGDLGEIPERNDFYFVLDLYENTESDFLDHTYRYICAPNGEVQYFESFTASIQRSRDNEEAWRQQECANLFAGRNGLNYWQTPFKVGDILYVDCRPYFLPTYCVIHYVDPEMPSDCCGLRCLYLTHCGYIGEAAVKHGGFLPTGLDDVLAGDRQFISPLYRAEIFHGKLPEKYAVLNTLGEKLKESPELRFKIDRYFFGDMKDASRYVTFTSQVTIADSPESKAGQETGICDRRKEILAVSEDRLFRFLE
ncbi:MAG: hypothetical protein LUF32_08335 [Clostridiales bacterium]|nr:hypothetical protein [Clostridiales bacterium]